VCTVYSNGMASELELKLIFFSKLLEIEIKSLRTWKKQVNDLTNNIGEFDSHEKPQLMTHVWGKVCGFHHYNVQYVTNIILNWQFDIW